MTTVRARRAASYASAERGLWNARLEIGYTRMTGRRPLTPPIAAMEVSIWSGGVRMMTERGVCARGAVDGSRLLSYWRHLAVGAKLFSGYSTYIYIVGIVMANGDACGFFFLD